MDKLSKTKQDSVSYCCGRSIKTIVFHKHPNIIYPNGIYSRNLFHSSRSLCILNSNFDEKNLLNVNMVNSRHYIRQWKSTEVNLNSLVANDCDNILTNASSNETSMVSFFFNVIPFYESKLSVLFS